MRVLFIDTVHDHLWSHLTRMDYDCTDGSEWSRSQILEQIAGYEGVIIRSRIKIDADFLAAAKKLRFVARAGSGMENIDVEHAKMLGVECFNAPEGNRDAVAEHAVGMLLGLFNHIHTSDREVRKGVWLREPNRGVELLGRTIGIIGYGNTGQAFAKRLAGFGVLTYAHDKLKKNFADNLVIETNMESIYQEAEVISLHVPLTEETHHLVNDEFFEKLRNPIFLINTSRGKVVDTEALVRAIESGKVLGACLDVYEFEKFNFEQIESEQVPAAFKYLIESPKVILTPHVAGWTAESNAKIAHVLGEKIQLAYSQVH
ncbi:MAG: NAD(P)-dependent oxidoreductase [Flavobacteriales bacterium]